MIGWSHHVTGAEPSVRPDWLLQTLTDKAGAGQSPVGEARAGARGAKARVRESACASGGAFSRAVGGSRSASPEVSGAAERPPVPPMLGPGKRVRQGWVGRGEVWGQLAPGAQLRGGCSPSCLGFPFSILSGTFPSSPLR